MASSTDMAWDGGGMVCAKGELLTRSERYSPTSQFVVADVDLERLVQERARMTSFGDCATDHAASLGEMREVPVRFVPPETTVTLERTVERHPYVPQEDRKSTRLNSSHVVISYAVFCLKKKKKK